MQYQNAITSLPELLFRMEEQYLEDVGNSQARDDGGQPFPLRKILRWIVYTAAFLVPLLFLPFTSDVLDFNKEVLIYILAGAGLVLFLVDMIKEGTLRYRPSTFTWPLIGLLVAGIISVAFSVNRYTSIFGVGNSHSFSLMSLLSLAVLFFLALQVMEDRGRTLRNVFVGSLSLALLIGAFQMLGIHIFSGEAFSKSSFNTIGSLNALGFLAALLLPVFLISPGRSMDWRTILLQILRGIGFASALFILIVLNWTYIWIVAFIGVLAYIAFSSSSEVIHRKMAFFAFPMAIIILGILLIVIKFNWTSIKADFPVEVSPTHRISYSIAGDALKARPLGYGLENFSIGYDKLRPAASVNNLLFQARFTDATSEFATMAVEGGIPMIVAFLVFLLFLVRVLWKNIKNKFGGDADHGKLWASAFAAAVVFFLYPIPLTILFVFLFLIALGELSSSNDASSEKVFNLEDRSVYSLLGSVGFIVGLVAVLAGGYFMVNKYIANVQVAHASRASNANDAIASLVESINSYPHDARSYRILSQVLITQIADDLKKGPVGVSQAEFNSQLQNHIASVINVAVRGTEVDPSDSENWMNRGFIYQNLITLVNGSDEAAINMYNETLARSPANALARVRIGNIHLTLADTARKNNNREAIETHLKAAEDEYKAAIGLYNNYGQALYNLAAVYDRKGELPQAIKQFERLQATSPRDPSILFQLGLLYYRNNQKDAALRAWEQAVLSFPNYSNARWYLSLIYEERGDLKRALAEVEAIEKLNPDNELVIERLEVLNAGLRQIIPPEDVLDQTPLNNEQ
ncbi:MAG: tetratricopeptide repeat protein [Patescibacteria group bacterium]